MHIVLGVTGSIGAYKAGDIVRRLKEQGCAVDCVLTAEAERFIAPLTLQVLSERPIHTELFSLQEPGVVHTNLADRASLVLIAPATANLMAKLAHGLADDLLTCIVLATKAPVVLAPAMNVHMWQHRATQDNVRRLKMLGYHLLGPKVGNLACGYEAIGHLTEVEEIVRTALGFIRPAVRPATAPARARVAARRPAVSRRRK